MYKSDTDLCLSVKPLLLSINSNCQNNLNDFCIVASHILFPLCLVYWGLFCWHYEHVQFIVLKSQ